MDREKLLDSLKEELSSLASRAKYLKDNLENTIYHNASLQSSLEDLTKRQIKLKNDIETLKGKDSTLFEQLKVQIDKFCRDFKEVYDNFMLEKGVKDKDYAFIQEVLTDFKAPISDFKTEINIKELKSEQDELFANREIIIKNTRSGIEVRYKAGSKTSDLWLEQFKQDIQENKYKWFKET